MTGTIHTQQDPLERVALNIDRIVRRHGSRTISATHYGLKSADRPLYAPALALAVMAGFVKRTATHLTPGPRDPNPFADNPAPSPHCRTCTCNPSGAPLS